MSLHCTQCRLPDTTAHQNVSCNENSRSSEPRKHLASLKPRRRDGRQQRVGRTEEEEEEEEEEWGGGEGLTVRRCSCTSHYRLISLRDPCGKQRRQMVNESGSGWSGNDSHQQIN